MERLVASLSSSEVAMQRRFKKDLDAQLDEYVLMVIDNIALNEMMTTEEKVREMIVFAQTLLVSKSKVMTTRQ
jgi:hypothetical protein